MAYAEDWYCFAEITVDKTKVGGIDVHMAVHLNEDNLPDMLLDADGAFAAKADGADIRFSSDAAGEFPRPFHIVEFTQDNDPANATANIWVRFPVSNAADQVFYVWWRNAAASALPVDDVVGQYETWNGPAPCRARWMCDDGEDASENDVDFSETNVAFVTGVIDDCASFDEDEAAAFTFPASQTEVWWEGWVYVDSAADEADGILTCLPFFSWITFAGAGYKIVLTAFFNNTDGIWREDTELAFDTWYHVSVSYDGALVTNDPVWAINGAQPAQTETQTPVGTILPFAAVPRGWLAGIGAAARLTGKLDEIALRLSAVSAATILAYETTRYNNQGDPAAFSSSGVGQIVRRSLLRPSRDHTTYQSSALAPQRAHLTSRGYEIWAENVSTKVLTLLGFVAHDASPLRLTGVTLADGTYDVLIYLEGYLWRDVRLVDVLRVTVSGGVVSAALPPPVEDLDYVQIGDYTRLTWTWSPRFGCLAPDSFGIWASTSAPPSTAGAPDVVVLADSPRHYTGMHEQGASATYYAVAALAEATRGPESRLGPLAAAVALSSPPVQFADDESLG